MNSLFYFALFYCALLPILIVTTEREFLQNSIQRPNWFESKLNTKDTFKSASAGNSLGDILHRLRKDSMNSLEEKNLLTDVLVSFYLSQLQEASEFPTAFTTANISEQCKQDSVNYVNAYQTFQLWALQMYESSGKFPEGLFGSRTLQTFGLFDECLAVEAQSFNDTTAAGIQTEVNFAGQYCSVFFDTVVLFPNETDFVEGEELSNNPSGQQQRDFWIEWAQIMQLLANGPNVTEPRHKDTDMPGYGPSLPRVDLCIPSSCSYEDLRIAVASFVGKRVISSFNDTENNNQLYFVAVTTAASDGYCFTKKEVETTPNFDGPDIAVIVVLSILGSLALVATLHEGWREYRNRPVIIKEEDLPVRVLNCFSSLNCGRKLLSTDVKSSENLNCLNGIRVLSTTWVVMGHSFLQASWHTMFNGIFLLQEAYKWQFHGAMTMGTLAVDTFFLMSGLLVAYLLLRELERNKGRFNVIYFYTHRYLRLTPVYAVILGFMATLMIYTTTGPNWDRMVYFKTACRYNWWNNLLYVNNYVQTYPRECMGETWYLACDIQMFILSPLFIYPLWRSWKIGLSWIISTIIALQIGIVAVYIIYDLPATSFATRFNEMANPYYYPVYYVPMWSRFPPYLIGILLGWSLHCTKQSKCKMSQMVVSFGWLAATTVSLCVVYGMVPYLDESAIPEMNNTIRVTFGAFNRLAWAFAVGWVIFACTNGYGGFVNRLLSWKAFIPIGRLIYVVYLIHFEYMYVYWSHARKPYYYTTFDHIQHYFGVLLMMFLLAFFISVTVEAPFLNLEKLLFDPVKQKKDQIEMKEEDGSSGSSLQASVESNETFITK